jgi:hypothetical protein
MSKINSCMNKQELDSASYFHNSIKTLKNEIQNFTLPKTHSARSEEKGELSKGFTHFSTTIKKNSVFYLFFRFQKEKKN